MEMFCSRYWDDFCHQQGIRSGREVKDPIGEGILGALLRLNSAMKVSYDVVGLSEPGDEVEAFHVEAYPAQMDFTSYLDGKEYMHEGPQVRGGKIKPYRIIGAGGWNALCLLRYGSIIGVWSGSLDLDGSVGVPQYWLFDDRYLRVVALCDEQTGQWQEVVIDLEFPIVVLTASHLVNYEYDVLRLLRVEEWTAADALPRIQHYKWSWVGPTAIM